MHYSHIHKLSCLIIALLFNIVAFAAPARELVVAVTQPDGTILNIRMVGDEFSHYTETTDGMMVTKCNDGTWRYTIKQKDGTISAGQQIAHDKQQRDIHEISYLKQIDQSDLRSNLISITRGTNLPLTKAASIHEQGVYSTSTFPTKGEVNGLVLLVDFPDRSFSLDDNAIKTKFNNMLNKTGYKDTIVINGISMPGAYGSAKDYFEAQSFGQFSPTFDIIGPIEADNGYAYYGQNDANGYDEIHTAELIKEIIQKVHINGMVDFSRYDNDKNMEIDFIYVIYAGKGENYTNSDPYTIWPHQWSIECQLGNYYAGKYACSPEIYADVDYTIDGIGTFCHEFSHILGLPDFYPSNNADASSTLREWSVMDYGCYDNNGYCPVGYTALERYSLGWMKLTEISTPGNYELPAIDISQTAYLLPSDKKPSYIILETHNRWGWYQYQPSEGLLITSVDYNRSAWTSNSVNNDPQEQRYRVIAADNDYSIYTKKGDLFPYNGNDSLTLYSNPPSITGCGISINIPITNIRYSNGTSTFTIADRSTTSVDESTTTFNDGLTYSIKGDCIILNSDTATEVTVYSISGRLVGQATLQTGSSNSIRLPQKGLYLLRYNNKVIKITY